MGQGKGLKMRIKFWGVRGSIATPERRNSRYGGNTPCVEVRLDDGTLIILDCGTGLRQLGKNLVRHARGEAIRGNIFLTHFHWDHIQGIPFFLPFYSENNSFVIRAAARRREELNAILSHQMADPFFPITTETLRSTRHFCEAEEWPVRVGSARVSFCPLHHPQNSVAYRIEADGSSFVYSTDTEPGSPQHDLALRNLSSGAAVLVYDAQYTPGQLHRERRGWGHSSWLEGTRIAKEARVKQLVLFHHDPDSDDAHVDSLVERARQEFPLVWGAAEGMVLTLRHETARQESDDVHGQRSVEALVAAGNSISECQFRRREAAIPEETYEASDNPPNTA
jgi:phosphoribosyl 1,2-cyclic phosphodiesterase